MQRGRRVKDGMRVGDDGDVVASKDVGKCLKIADISGVKPIGV
jgi:hypothetical protein